MHSLEGIPAGTAATGRGYSGGIRARKNRVISSQMISLGEKNVLIIKRPMQSVSGPDGGYRTNARHVL